MATKRSSGFKDPQRSAALKGNKNAAKGPMANGLVEYKTGMLGAIGLGKTHTGFSYTNRKGVTAFRDKDGNPGLPANTTSLRMFKLTKKK